PALRDGRLLAASRRYKVVVDRSSHEPLQFETFAHCLAESAICRSREMGCRDRDERASSCTSTGAQTGALHRGAAPAQIFAPLDHVLRLPVALETVDRACDDNSAFREDEALHASERNLALAPDESPGQQRSGAVPKPCELAVWRHELDDLVHRVSVPPGSFDYADGAGRAVARSSGRSSSRNSPSLPRSAWARSSTRRIFPLIVFGNSANSRRRTRLYG